MRDRNIYAYTAPGSDFPDYISINRKDERIVITVRSGHAADLAEIVLPEDQLDLLIYTLRGARPANLHGSGDNPAAQHLARRQPTDAPAFSVPTNSIEKAQMKGRKRRSDRDREQT